MTDLLDRLRSLKHRAYRVQRRAHFAYAVATEPLVQAWHQRFPQQLREGDFAGLFTEYSEPLTRETTEPVDRRITAFWTGPNEMTANRARAFDTIRRANPNIEVRLITDDSLDEILVPEAPLHPSYYDLCYVHRADYLRCYLMHFHGGGYTDIKYTQNDWTVSFDRMDATDGWLMGYRNPVRVMTPNFADRQLERLMVKWSDRRLGQCAYIGRPRTPISAEWWRELNHKLDNAAEALAANPGNARGTNLGYPLQWNGILAHILDPLSVKYADHLVYEKRLQMKLEDYE